MIYVFLNIALGFQALVQFTQRTPLAKFTGLILVAVFALVAGLRGAVGTDTYAYFNIVNLYIDGAELSLEPAFLAFIDFTGLFTDEASLIVNLYSLLFFGAVSVFAIRATRAELIYLFCFFAPQYFLIYSMNGIRIGLASIFFLLFYQSWMRRKRVQAAVLGALAMGFHFTILIGFALLFFGSSTVSTRTRMIVQFLGLAFVLIMGAFLFGYVESQVLKYSTAESFSIFSGLSIVAKMLIFTAFVGKLPLARGKIVSISFVAISALLFSFAVSQFSYAGLRLLDIVAWITPLLYLGSLGEKQPGPRFEIGMAVVGLLGALAVLRNIYSSAGESATPFLPYMYFWENAL